MSGEILIRQMRTDDIERVLEIAAGLKNMPHWPRIAYLTALDPHAQPRRVSLVAVDTKSDLPIGFAIANLVPPGAELETIAMAAEHQRRGWAGALLERLFEELRLDGVKEIWLEVRVSNEAAFRVYRRAGLVEAGTRKGYYADPVEDATVMRLTFS
jgi:[ribosomal protein S18]-alanine N-acetyltransferase